MVIIKIATISKITTKIISSGVPSSKKYDKGYKEAKATIIKRIDDEVNAIFLGLSMIYLPLINDADFLIVHINRNKKNKNKKEENRIFSGEKKEVFPPELQRGKQGTVK